MNRGTKQVDVRGDGGYVVAPLSIHETGFYYQWDDAFSITAPDVFNHNLETVPRLYRQARPGADYQNSHGKP